MGDVEMTYFLLRVLCLFQIVLSATMVVAGIWGIAQ